MMRQVDKINIMLVCVYVYSKTSDNGSSKIGIDLSTRRSQIFTLLLPITLNFTTSEKAQPLYKGQNSEFILSQTSPLVRGSTAVYMPQVCQLCQDLEVYYTLSPSWSVLYCNWWFY